MALFATAGYWGTRRAVAWVHQARVSDWHVKTLVVSGVTGRLEQAVRGACAKYQNQPFTASQAAGLKKHLLKQYPMITDVAVRRGLLSGKLTVSVRQRVPLAKFIRTDGATQYIDADSTVYSDPHPPVSQVPLVELDGTVTEKLTPEFVELVQSTLKLNKELNFTRLRLNLADDTVRMYLQDGTELDFGSAQRLKEKALRGAQILTIARKKYTGPFILDFRFFENGKVFLTQNAL